MFRQLIAALDRNTAALNRLTGQEEYTMSALDDLTAKVAAQTSLDASAATLISGLADQLKAAAANNDTAQIQALADQLSSASAPLAAAVAANTPAASASSSTDASAGTAPSA